MALSTIPILNNMTEDRAEAIRRAADERAKQHLDAEAHALVDSSMATLARILTTPAAPVFTPAPATREPVVHFGIDPEDAARFEALLAHAVKRAEQAKLTLRGNEKVWELGVIAAHGARHRIGRVPVDSFKGQTVWPLHGRDDSVIGHVTLTPGQGITGVKIFDSFGAVMFAIGLPMCRGEHWSRFTRGFDRVAKVKPEVFKI